MNETNYKIIYSFEVVETCLAGVEVCMLDRVNNSVSVVNHMKIVELATVLDSKDTSNRFEFWIKEKFWFKEN
jgi:hypothetical protein